MLENYTFAKNTGVFTRVNEKYYTISLLLKMMCHKCFM